MNDPIRHESKSNAASIPQPSSRQTVPPAGAPHDATLQAAARHIAEGRCERALSLLGTANRSPRVENARGVCLLRLGRADEALKVFRGLVLQPGCTWMRPEAPAAYKINLATALLLSGHPAGCLELLAEIDRGQHPAGERLHQAIKDWVATLSFLQKLNWWLGRIEPPDCRVKVDFPPGELDSDPASAATPHPSSPPPPAISAA